MTGLLDEILHASNTGYMTHGFHPYPAKFIPQIPRRAIEKHSRVGDLVCDPFCGSGTTLVEARLLSRRSIGNDIHPIATLASRAKTACLKPAHTRRITGVLSHIRDDFRRGRFSSSGIDFYNRDHWFVGHVQDEIGIILRNINDGDNAAPVKTFLKAMLSSIIVKVSNQHSDTRYAAVEKSHRRGGVVEMFVNKTTASLERMREFEARVDEKAWCRVYTGDARNMTRVDDHSVNMIVTSPPYPNVYDYYLYHKHRMHWLGMDIDNVKDNEIGSRLRYSSLRWDIDTFQCDMDECVAEMHRMLKPHGVAVVVIGDSVVQREMISGYDVMKRSAKMAGFRVADRIQYELDRTSRSFAGSYRQRGKKEHVVTMVKK